MAADQWGVVSLDELRECGLPDAAVRVRARNGRLHRLHRGVYAVGHPTPPLEGCFLAAVKACGKGAVLSHLSAAALWGFVPWEERRLEVTVPGTVHRAHPGLRVHRTCELGDRDLGRHKGVPATAPGRTIVDLASTFPYKPLRAAVRRAQSLRLVNVVQLNETLMRTSSRRGVGTLRRILATGPAPTRSELEDVVLDLILRGGLAHPDVNVPLHMRGRRVIPDFRWPGSRLVVEADGATWHENALARADDADRQALLEAHGERVVRVTWNQALTQPGQTLARLRAAGAPPVAESSGT
jgi:hypothetical protein